MSSLQSCLVFKVTHLEASHLYLSTMINYPVQVGDNISLYVGVTLEQEHFHHMVGNELKQQREDMQKSVDNMMKVRQLSLCIGCTFSQSAGMLLFRFLVFVVILHRLVFLPSSVHLRVHGRSCLGSAGLVRANTVILL